MSGPIVFASPNSLLVRKGRSWKRARRIEMVARLETMFISDQDIAITLGITVPAVTKIKQSLEYQAKRIALNAGTLSVYDEALEKSLEDKRVELDYLHSMAMSQAKRILMDRTDPNHGKMVMDMFDRNESTAKITKQKLSVDEKPDFSRENLRAQELVKMLGVAPEPEVQAIVPEIGVTEHNKQIELANQSLLDNMEAQENTEAQNQFRIQPEDFVDVTALEPKVINV